MKRLSFFLVLLLAVGVAGYAVAFSNGSVWYDTEAVIAKVGHKVVCAVTSTSDGTVDYSIEIFRKSGQTKGKSGGISVDDEEGTILPWETKHLEVSAPSGSIVDRTFLCKVHLDACVSGCEPQGRVSILVRTTAGQGFGTGDAPPQKKNKKKATKKTCDESGYTCLEGSCCDGLVCDDGQCLVI